ncbi:MAG TPA: hypothetical protein VMW66_03845 [Elusimicrobiales bacterium]|nr:hypothetical protein [Elusimicrobiales bacterium]
MESFKHNFDKPKKEEKQDKSPTVTFKASIEGLASLKDGGITLRLGLSGNEYITTAKLLAAKNENKLLDIFAQIIEPKTLGGNV